MTILPATNSFRKACTSTTLGRDDLIPMVAARYERCHLDDTFEDLCNRARFSKEDRRLLEDWLSVFAAGAVPPTDGKGRAARSVDGVPTVAADMQGAVEIDASVVAMGLGLEASQIPELMRLGEITSICETGINEDEGRHRLTFFFRNTRLSLVIDLEGQLLERGTIRFGDRPLPASLRRPRS